jgi:hypothetical protein
MNRLLHVGWTALVLLPLAVPAAAQPAPPANSWSHGTTLNVFAGAGADSSRAGALAGTSIGWEITPAMAIEGSGYWLDRGAGPDAFAAALKLQVGLMMPRGAVPFVSAGVGLYRATVDGASNGTMPDFYRRRMTGAMGPTTLRTFTDPSFILGGGVNVFMTPHIALRPNVETMFVRRHGHGHVVTALAVHLAYHFESHPVR